eukprot:scaffold34157_cov76-Skeletonema_marinoi.AAC.1
MLRTLHEMKSNASTENDSGASFAIPISREWLDIAAYRTIYDHNVDEGDPDAQLRKGASADSCCRMWPQGGILSMHYMRSTTRSGLRRSMRI